MTKKHPIDELKDRIIAFHPLIAVDTQEEKRLIRNFRTKVLGLKKRNTKAKKDKPKEIMELYVWSLASGVRKLDPEQAKTSIWEMPRQEIPGLNDANTAMGWMPSPVLRWFESVAKTGGNQDTHAILFMLDLHTTLKGQLGFIIARTIKDISQSLATSNKHIVMVGACRDYPEALRELISFVDYPLPSEEEVSEQVNETLARAKKVSEKAKKSADLTKKKAKGFDYKMSAEKKHHLVTSLQGLSRRQIQKVLNLSFWTHHKADIELVKVHKKEVIRQNPILEYWDSVETLSNVGGMDLLKKWLQERAVGFTENALRFGCKPPKGILLLGVPGCGKSLVAKAIPAIFDVPLVRLDMGKVFAGVVGSSESNMRLALNTVDAMGVATLWMDEVEKGTSGTHSSSYSDAGTTSRVFGTLVTWLQERTKPVFLVATSNDISKTPAEFLRRGRLDDIFFVDIPSRRERREIYSIHLTKAGRNPEDFDLDYLAGLQYDSQGKKYNYTGADIEEAINGALYKAFKEIHIDKTRDEKDDINIEDIEANIEPMIPLSKTMEKEVRKARKFVVEGRARPASSDTNLESNNTTSGSLGGIALNGGL